MRSAPFHAALIAIVLSFGCGDRELSPAFDFTHVERAIAYFDAPSETTLIGVAASDAARHLKRHSDFSGYFSADATPMDITRALIASGDTPNEETLARVGELIGLVKKDPRKQYACLADAAKYSPRVNAEPVKIYATWGYDIGVATDIGASLNFAHPHFLKTPNEIWFYCVHEAHHVGAMRLHGFPKIAETTTVGDLVELIRYLTFLEGTAVFAALPMREKEGALDADEDYVALADLNRMNMVSARFEVLLGALSARAESDALTDADWNIIEEMSGGERLWYRHGAKMAKAIYDARGIDEFVAVIADGPKAFFDSYAKVSADN